MKTRLESHRNKLMNASAICHEDALFWEEFGKPELAAEAHWLAKVFTARALSVERIAEAVASVPLAACPPVPLHKEQAVSA